VAAGEAQARAARRRQGSRAQRRLARRLVASAPAFDLLR
jgi:hypothetical protein